MLVMGIDPGTATTGFGLVRGDYGKETLIDYGVIRTSATISMPRRLAQINREYSQLLLEYRPDAVAIEQIFHHKNAKTVITVAQSRGVLLMATASREIEVAEYTPLQVKQAVTGYGHADKKQVQVMIQKILKLEDFPRPDDAADALAIALCHLHSYRWINAGRKGGLS
ncbi:MAG: crossover junction endodeoxyribonuclease RuvC [Syntrophomonadaceae bacterium]|nr:crossover junction endodeoxyribonuclease RuvC [Syntrophomonadaceae bacterium]